LAACGGLSAESAKERLLTADDFDFEVQVDSSSSDPSITDIFSGECSEIDLAEKEYSKSNVVAESKYEERSDSQNGFYLREYVIQFPTKEDASTFVASVEKVARNSDCEWYYSTSSKGAFGSSYGIGSEDFGNVRDLQTAFKVDADESVVLDIDSSMVISGTFLSTNSSDEGGAAFATSGDLVVIVSYEVESDDISSSSDPVTRLNLENVVALAFKKMLG
jgi:hypothetical protein